MTTTLFKVPTVQTEVLKEGGPQTLEAMLATLPDNMQVQINDAADELIAQIPALPMAGVGRHAVLQRVRNMAIEFTLFGYKLGFDHGTYEAVDGRNS
ncbi:hypothetical protein ADP64_000065 [Achromobacter phage phiAxp-2]|uniref:Uncharacterized protein n=1 Tax=Achromobacter phage phiAxp-2 TaxID=1664246 RepID=A0A0K2FHS1_9CAUD|nr:hypothetical protein ADP64_000065 [Achromobacter phage phiAxp-2]ALA45405.1 hypothetical protein ADP64_000065 [Achromobacter phage phiAxp-2]